MIKKVRYLYWLVLEFIKKHRITIILTFIVSFILLTFLTTPIEKVFFDKKRIGLVGRFTFQNLPEEVSSLISNPLLSSDEKGNYLPVLLSSWEREDDFKKFRLILRKNVLWNDGKEITSDDINIKIKEAKVDIKDRYTILITFDQPTPNFLKYLTKPLIRPGLIGAAGKYKVRRYQIKDGLITNLYLVPNIINLPILEFKIYPTEEEMAINYKMGKIDMMTLKKKELADNFTGWKNSKVTKLVDYKHIFVIFFNNKKEIFKDKEFKKALRKAINKKKLSPLGEENQSPISLNSIYYYPNLPLNIYSPDYAIEYINSHFNDSRSSAIKINLYTYYDYFKLAEEITNQLNKINIDTQIVFIREQIPDNFDLMLTLLELPEIENQYLLWHSEQKNTNISHYKSEKIDKILENLRLSYNFEDKKKAAFEFQKIFNDNPGAIFLFHPYVYLIERK